MHQPANVRIITPTDPLDEVRYARLSDADIDRIAEAVVAKLAMATARKGASGPDAWPDDEPYVERHKNRARPDLDV